MNGTIDRKFRRAGDQGMTVIELMVGLSLAAVAAVVVYTIFISTQGAFVDTKDFTDTQSDARVVLGMIAQEVRAAGSDPNDADGIDVEPLSTCYADTMRLQSDFNGNGIFDAVAEPPEDVVWFHDAGNLTLVRRTPGGDMPILRNVLGFDITYFDGQGNELADYPLDAEDRRRVRAVRVDVRVRITRDAERNWSTVAALRNDPSI